VVSGLALLYCGWVLVLWMSNDSHLVAGWSSTIVIVSLLCVYEHAADRHRRTLCRPHDHAEGEAPPAFMWCRSGSASSATRPRRRTPRCTPGTNSARMTELFDSYRRQLPRRGCSPRSTSPACHHSFFMRAKADLLRELIARRLGPEKPAMLDVGCGVGGFHPLLRRAWSAA